MSDTEDLAGEALSAAKGLRRPAGSVIRTPDQRLRVFVSSTLQELAEERAAAREAITKLRLAPVLFELGARPHPPRDLYRAYLQQSHIFIGIYWERYGWVAPGEDISGLEDEYRLSGAKPKLIYIKTPAPKREPRLGELLDRIRGDDTASYKYFLTASELGELIENDLAVLLTESFEMARVGQELPVEAPARHAGNLPLQPTPFIGREKEITAVRDLLRREDVRLVTLVGPGGVGKSRLALQAAGELLADFEDGVFFVSLASINEPSRVASALAEVLGVHEGSGHPLLDSLKDYLRAKRLLLLLDNFEQVVAAAPVVSELLAAAPHVQVLATSRAALRIRGEYEFPVPPMSLPQPGRFLSPERLSQYEAVRLFVERAQAVKPDFAVSRENVLAVAEICRRLDGLPLAIELAAARVRFLPPRALLARLTSSLDFLKSGARDLPGRQQTLRSTIDWSYDLLSQEEQTLFARLGVFVRGCTLDALEAVCDPDRVLNALDVVGSLVDKSLVRHVEEKDSAPRFVLLETIREFAQEKLRGSGEADVIRDRHLEYFLTLAEQTEPQLKGPQQMAGLNRLEAEHDNLRAALAWALEDAHQELAQRLAAALHWFWFVRGYWSEGREWLGKALAADDGRDRGAWSVEREARTAGGQGGRGAGGIGPLPCSPAPLGSPSSVVRRPDALNAAGLLAWYQGDVAVARALLNESVALCRQSGDKRNLAYALAYLSTSVIWMGDAGEGRARGEESAALFQEIGDRWGRAYVLLNLGAAAYWQGDYGAARAFSEESLALYQEIGDRWRASGPLGRLGDLAYREGDFARARALYEESLAIFREIGDKPGIVAGLNPLGDVARAQGDYEQAAGFYGESLALALEIGDKFGIAWARYSLGKVAWLQGAHAWARTLFEDSLALLRQMGDQGGVAWLLQNLGHLALDEHVQHPQDGLDIDQVSRLFREAMAMAQEQGHRVTIAFCLLGFAALAGLSGQPERAARLFGAAQVLYETSGAAMSAADRIEYEYNANGVGAYIDREGYPAAVAEGRAMSAQQAIAYAIEGQAPDG